MAVQDINPLLVEEVQLAWKHAVRAFNVCENEDGRLQDSEATMLVIVGKLSQQLEYLQEMSQIAAQIPSPEQET